MSSYNSYDGIPVAADYHILTEILREEWGYKYHVVTDVSALFYIYVSIARVA